MNPQARRTTATAMRQAGRRAAAWLSIGVCAIAPAWAGTTTIYRCGATGNVYGQLPCPGGTAFDAGDHRTPDERAAALRIAEAERRRAAALQADRLRAQANQPLATAGTLGPATPKAPVATARSRATPQSGRRTRRLRAGTDGDGDFIAYSPAPPKKQKP